MRIILAIITVLLFSLEASCQTQLPEKLEISMPDYIRESTNNWVKEFDSWQDYALSRIKKNDFGKPNKIEWTAYSDRDSNTTYSSPASTASFSKLSFMDKVYIADVKNGYALIFTDEYAIDYPKINSTAKSKGWIPLDNLLLWEKCLQNKNSIFQKALVYSDVTKNEKSAYLTSFEKPFKLSGIEILFIMKQINIKGKRYYLLSKEITIKERESVVKGWLPEEYVTFWDHRFCLEPSCSSKSVSYYRNLGLFPSVYNTLSEAEILYMTGKQGSPIWIYKDFGFKRMDTYNMRFPIINAERKNDNNGIYKVLMNYPNKFGYAPVTLKTSESYRLFDYVLFFSQDELKDIIKELKKLESTSLISKRKAYQDAIVAMGQAFLGQMSADEIMGMSMDELTAQIYGVPVPISNCGVKIEDIINPRKISDTQLQEYINDFNTKRRGLENIANNSYDGKFKSNEIVYLWIPLTNMPGYCAEQD
jgi:hypothetical protein